MAFFFFLPENRAVYESRLKYIVQPGTPQMKIWAHAGHLWLQIHIQNL